MENIVSDHARPAGAPGRLLVFALAVVTVLLALTLAAREFQAGLNSDLLWTQVFAHDLGDPLHPVSGWRFGSATFWFPDFGLFLPLYWLFGDSGLNYPLYTVLFYLLLGATMAWALVEAGVAKVTAAIATFLALDVLLLCQFIPGHAHALWLIGIPCDHGGNLVNGFAVLALGLNAARQRRWTRWRSITAIAVMTLGLLSNALLLFHWIIPLALALFWASQGFSTRTLVFMGFVSQAALALLLVVAARVVMALTGWFLFYRLARDWPLPTRIGETFALFFSDLTQHGLFTGQWLFAVLAAAAILIALGNLRRRQPDAEKNILRIAYTTGLLSLALAWAMPIATLYWHDNTSFRYMLNWLPLPAWMLALWLCREPARARWVPRLAVAVSMLGVGLAVPNLDNAKLVFSFPPETQTLRDYCVRNNLQEGLADYWNEHVLRVAWKFGSPRLGQIREKDFSYFWCSNAFDYFPPAPDGKSLQRPAPQFVVLNGLDRAQITAWLGGTPLRIEPVGPYEVALLTPAQMRHAAELIETQSMAILAGRRARWLTSQLPPAP